MLAVFCKSLSNGTVSITAAAPDWDILKYALSKVDYFEMHKWVEQRFAFESLREGYIITTDENLWRVVNLADDTVKVDGTFEIFEGRIILFKEIDSIF